MTAGDANTTHLEIEAFHGLPHGVLALGGDGRVIAWNRKAAELLGEIDHGASCCSLLCTAPGGSPAGGCFSDLARERDEPLPEVRVELGERGSASAAWVTAARLRADGSRIVIHLRPGEAGDRRRRTEPHWAAAPKLEIHTLGRTEVFGREGRIGGRWLEQRPGQILKYLVAERDRAPHVDEIADSIWPEADMNAAATVRYFVHALRARVEPEHPKRTGFSFVVARQGGYALERSRVTIDADEFEAKVRAGLDAFRGTEVDAAERLLADAISLYKGDFLADERYADWVLPERNRLRKVASDAIRALGRIRLDAGDLERAVELAARLTQLQPYDPDVHRHLIALLLTAGRRSDASRHYAALRKRMMREFGEQPEFKLSEVTPADATAFS
jgi:DNA-binding SARP family transcriptional activator